MFYILQSVMVVVVIVVVVVVVVVVVAVVVVVTAMLRVLPLNLFLFASLVHKVSDIPIAPLL
jgi:hypothetical protein